MATPVNEQENQKRQPGIVINEEFDREFKASCDQGFGKASKPTDIILEAREHFVVKSTHTNIRFLRMVRTDGAAFESDEDVRAFLSRFISLDPIQEKKILRFVRACKAEDPEEAPVLTITGPEGSGKTTLGRILTYLIPDVFVLDGLANYTDVDTLIDTMRIFLKETPLILIGSRLIYQWRHNALRIPLNDLDMSEEENRQHFNALLKFGF